LAPERKRDRPAAEHLFLPFASEDVLELDIPEHCLGFGDEVVDRLMTATRAMNDDLLGSCLGFLRLGHSQWNLTFFLLRTRIRGGSGSRGWRGLLRLDHRGLDF